MAYSQLDPARLQGEALTRWYLRSPADIEQERRAAAAQRHSEFFGGIPSAPVTANNQLPAKTDGGDSQGVLWVASGPNRWSGQSATSQDPRSSLARVANGLSGKSSDGSTGTQLAANGEVCRACHGGVPPVPPGGIFSFRDTPPSSPSSPSRPPEPDRKQCEQQLQSDTEICAQQPNNASKSICREDAMKRYAHCRKTGEVGEPYLFTVTRMPRR